MTNQQETRELLRKRESEVIHFIITGGTIDSYFDVSLDTIVPFKESCLPKYMASVGFNEKNAQFSTVCMKDSRKLIVADFNVILELIEKSKCSRFIITHGTYTMPDTARYIEAHLSRDDATVVLTGSMKPIMGFPESDAPFNLGHAISQVRQLPLGVYICMHGRTYLPQDVAKSPSEGRFYSIFD